MANEFDGRETFTVAEAQRAGLPRSRIDARRWERPFRGLRSMPAPIHAEHPAQRQRDEIVLAASRFAVLMHPGEYLSHTTAAVLWDIPLPMLPDAVVHVSVAGRAPRMRGLRGHQIRPTLARVVEHPTLGVRLTDPATTWAMLGGMLRHPYDLIAAGDAVVRRARIPGTERLERQPLATLDDLAAAVDAGRRVGIGSLRLALPRIRTGSASRPESWLRLELVDSGLPEPAIDHDVFDARGGFVGCLDQAYPDARVGIEYEGDQHRTEQRQWQRDVEKHEALADLGWRIVRVSRDQLFDSPGRVAGRVRAAIGRA